MKSNYISWLIAASALSILALIWFQVNWMQHSRMLLEEQFNNRVNMALCSTVEKIADNPDGSNAIRNCCQSPTPSDSNLSIEDLMKQPGMESALTEALHFYQIDLPYKVSIAPKDSFFMGFPTGYACSLGPILENDTHVLQLEFKGKTEYFLQKMGLMVFASIAILACLCLIFGFATFYLLRQKRMADRNRDFFNHMTHEFRTPLTSIRLAANMLAKKTPSLKDNTYLGIIQSECNQLVHQVENVLNLGSIEKGEYQLKKERVQLGQIAQEVVAGMDLQIKESEAQVTLTQDSSPGTIFGDPLHLANALRNLLDNALKYSGPQPEIHIDLREQAGFLLLQFSDNGNGLSSADSKRIFQKFHRCDNALESGQKGFGLGLTYVKKIVELHHGQIEVSSPEGRGACFELRFPVSK
ncbi:MAG: HAMP domain-containing sensor histidine kinase [Saprospiraceae bacterium]